MFLRDMAGDAGLLLRLHSPPRTDTSSKIRERVVIYANVRRQGIVFGTICFEEGRGEEGRIGHKMMMLMMEWGKGRREGIKMGL